MQNTTHKTQAFEYGQITEDNTMQPQEVMLQEIQQILKKHQALNRFGLTRIIGIYDPTIIMNENCLLNERLLITTPKTKEEIIPDEVLETQWRLDVPGMLKACRSTCENTPEGHDGISHPGGGQKPQQLIK